MSKKILLLIALLFVLSIGSAKAALVAYYPLNATTNDYSGNGWNQIAGTTPSVITIAGRTGMNFTGNEKSPNDNVQFGNYAGAVDGSTSFTIEGWIYAYRFCGGGTNGNWFSLRNDSGFHFYSCSGGNPALRWDVDWSAGGGLLDDIVLNPHTLQWYYIGFTWNKGNNSIKWYLNGSLVGTDTIAGAIEIKPNQNALGMERATSDFFAGVISDVKIWSEVKGPDYFNNTYYGVGGAPANTGPYTTEGMGYNTAGPITYTFTHNYGWSQKWLSNDTNPAISSCVGSYMSDTDSVWHNISCTVSTNTSIMNITGMKAGIETVKMYVEDSNSLWAVSGTGTMNITKAQPNVSITVTSPVINGTMSDYFADVLSHGQGDADIVYDAWRNGTELGPGYQIGDGTKLAHGTYIYLWNNTVGQNYTSVTSSQYTYLANGGEYGNGACNHQAFATMTAPFYWKNSATLAQIGVRIYSGTVSWVGIYDSDGSTALYNGSCYGTCMKPSTRLAYNSTSQSGSGWVYWNIPGSLTLQANHTYWIAEAGGDVYYGDSSCHSGGETAPPCDARSGGSCWGDSISGSGTSTFTVIDQWNNGVAIQVQAKILQSAYAIQTELDVLKLPTSCTLTGLTNHTYGTTDSPECICNATQGTTYFYWNGTAHPEWNFATVTMPAGDADWNCYYPESADYQASGIIVNQNITQKPTSCSLTGLTNHTYGSADSPECICNESYPTTYLYWDGVAHPEWNFANPVIPANIDLKEWRCYEGGGNYSYSVVSVLQNVSKAPTSCSLTGITNHGFGPTNTVLCTCNYSTTFLSWNTSIGVWDDHPEWNNTAVQYPAGTHSFICEDGVTSNYTSDIQEVFQTITPATTACQMLGITNHTYGTPMTPLCLCNNSGSMTRLYYDFYTNITAQNNTAFIDGAGVHNYDCVGFYYGNYTNATSWVNNIVTKLAATCSLIGLHNGSYAYTGELKAVCKVSPNDGDSFFNMNGTNWITHNNTLYDYTAGLYNFNCYHPDNDNITFCNSFVRMNITGSQSMNPIMGHCWVTGGFPDIECLFGTLFSSMFGTAEVMIVFLLFIAILLCWRFHLSFQFSLVFIVGLVIVLGIMMVPSWIIWFILAGISIIVAYALWLFFAGNYGFGSKE